MIDLHDLFAEWRDRAACKGKSDLFFDEDRWVEARKICVTCPVYLQCSDYRDTHSLDGGVWAGLSMSAQSQSKRRRNARRLTA